MELMMGKTLLPTPHPTCEEKYICCCFGQQKLNTVSVVTLYKMFQFQL